VIQLKGKSLVAVSHSNGIQVVDPVSGESDNYIIEGGHPNCCCTIDDKIIVSASNRGIFVAEKKGGTERLVPLKLFGEGFGGYVKSHKKVLYYSSGKSIFSATVGEKGLVEREVDSVPDRIYHFALHPEAGLLRIFATCSGGVYRLDMKEGDRMAESSFVRIHRSARSSGAKSRFNLIGVDYVFDDYYVIVSKDDKLLLLDRNAKEADKRSKDESIMGEFDVPGNISSFACDPFGGIVVASNTHGAPQLHHVSKGKEGKSCSSKIGLPDYDLTGYSVRSGEYAEFRRINSIVVYSQPIG
jgi:hypothetical protein